MQRLILDLVVSLLPILVLVGFWVFVMVFIARRQKATPAYQERMLAAAEKQATELARIADALDAWRNEGRKG